jgi:hypothetical protein
LPISEGIVRDYLAADLSVLEHGLRFEGKEVHLPSKSGSAGRIDIVARDLNGMLVVIELKISRDSSREAAHEIMKYTRILAEANGLGPEDVRCIIASTDWRELSQSFFEVRNKWDYRLDGYQLKLHDSGQIASCRPVTLQQRGAPVYVCPEHLIFLFKQRADRDRHVPRLVAAMRKMGIEDSVLLSLDYDGEDDRVIYPHCAYLALGRMILSAPSSDADEMDEEPWALEQNALAALLRAVPSSCVESAGPDTIMKMTAWRTIATHRSGRFEGELIWDDTALQRRVGGEGLVLTSRFEDSGSPKNAARWARLRESALAMVADNANWHSALLHCFRMTEQVDPEGTVEIYIFDPQDLILSLQSAQQDNMAYLPWLRYTHKGNPTVDFTLVGALEWTKPGSENWNSLLVPYGGITDGYLAHRTYSDTSFAQKGLVEHLGLSYETLLEHGDTLVRARFNDGKFAYEHLQRAPHTLAEFVEDHPDLGRWLDGTISPVAPFPSNRSQ